MRLSPASAAGSASCIVAPACTTPTSPPSLLCLWQDSLYAEAASWANPAELEQQLARAAERRKRGLRGEELRAVKQRKAELKEKKRREWLLN